MNKLSRSEVISILGLDLAKVKTKFKRKGIKSQKRRSIKSWIKLFEFCGVKLED